MFDVTDNGIHYENDDDGHDSSSLNPKYAFGKFVIWTNLTKPAQILQISDLGLSQYDHWERHGCYRHRHDLCHP